MAASPSLDGDFFGGPHFLAVREELRVLDDAVQKLQDYLWGGAEQEEGIRVPTHGKLEELEALASAATLKGGEVLQKKSPSREGLAAITCARRPKTARSSPAAMSSARTTPCRRPKYSRASLTAAWAVSRSLSSPEFRTEASPPLQAHIMYAC